MLATVQFETASMFGAGSVSCWRHCTWDVARGAKEVEWLVLLLAMRRSCLLLEVHERGLGATVHGQVGLLHVVFISLPSSSVA